MPADPLPQWGQLEAPGSNAGLASALHALFENRSRIGEISAQQAQSLLGALGRLAAYPADAAASRAALALLARWAAQPRQAGGSGGMPVLCAVCNQRQDNGIVLQMHVCTPYGRMCMHLHAMRAAQPAPAAQHHMCICSKALATQCSPHPQASKCLRSLLQC